MKIQFNPKDDITVREIAFVLSQLDIAIKNISVFNKFPEGIKRHFQIDVQDCEHKLLSDSGTIITDSGTKKSYKCNGCGVTVIKD